MHRPVGDYIVITDSLSLLEALESQKVSFKTHSLILECKEILWKLQEENYHIVFMWVPSQVGITGNEKVDEIARNSAEEGSPWRQNNFRNDIFSLAKKRLLEEWQSRWVEDEMGRFTFSIYPKVSLRSWFNDMAETDRSFVVTTSRILSNHTRTRTHLYRIRIIADPVCVCMSDYETTDHILWQCPRFEVNRANLERKLNSIGIPFPSSIRDLLGL
jgi:hypothetical protein